jgi:hypothetical protein
VKGGAKEGLEMGEMGGGGTSFLFSEAIFILPLNWQKTFTCSTFFPFFRKAMDELSGGRKEKGERW